MKNTIKLIAVIAFALAAMSVSAQQVRLGHIDLQELIQSMPETVAAKKTLEYKQAEVDKESKDLQEQYKKRMNDYSKNLYKMSDVIRTAKTQELEEFKERIQRFEEIAANDLKKTQDDLFKPIMSKAMDAIKAVGKEEGFTYIYNMKPEFILFDADNAENVMLLVKKKLGLQ